MPDYEKQFPVITISRHDLAMADIPQAVIDTLTDDDMEALASELKEFLQMQWEDLQFVTRLYLAERKS